ncbi:hypothetical protein FPV16_17870 [Methylobacterium sp. W2]|uniref:hypothetical protein n=1 Tax=Methylobacterium sp. W2 TaxID=2598107 RepID=UPI001D0C02E3|nr:hypothetical protein [Methylobacterium sp. W2]MCC0808055.1 hypothetical protein [Methylobacterium sp. W2]
MSPREQAAYARGVREARQMAMIAAVTIEARDDHREVRQQAAAAALHGLAEGLKQLLPTKTGATLLPSKPLLQDALSSDMR